MQSDLRTLNFGWIAAVVLRSLASDAGATSSDPEHQLTSLWLQALIATDRRAPGTAEQYFPQLVDKDGDVDTVQQASLAVDKLVLDLRQEPRNLDMASCT